MKSLPYDHIQLPQSLVAITKSRPSGVDKHGKPISEPIPGSSRPENNEDPKLIEAYEKTLLNNLGLRPCDMYVALVIGRANVAFTNDLSGSALLLEPNGYHSIKDVDAIFGYDDTIKACRLGDCGLLVVEGQDRQGNFFNGFIHTTRLNMNGDDQFRDASNRAVGGVQLMLTKMLNHYQPTELRLHLVAGIAPQFYIHNLTPTEEELLKEPSLTAVVVRDRKFKGWNERGWIRPHLVEGKWDTNSYEVDMYAAIRHQVERAGLINCYNDEHIAVDGNPASGHASHRAAILGKVEETRDLYIVYSKLHT